MGYVGHHICCVLVFVSRFTDLLSPLETQKAPPPGEGRRGSGLDQAVFEVAVVGLETAYPVAL
jgi:hypothetical protein